MEITFVISEFSSGGAERYISLLANSFAAKNYTVHLITFNSGKDPIFYPLHPGVHQHHLDLLAAKANPFKRISNFLMRLFRLRQCLKSIKGSVVISFIEISNIITLLAAMGLRKKVIVCERTTPQFYPVGMFKSILRKLTYPFARKIIVQTKSAADFFSPSLQPKIIVIPNFIPAPPQVIGSYNLASKIILTIGRLEKVKGYDLLIDAFALIHQKHPDWSLVIWGEGGERKNLEKQIYSYNLQKSITLPGVTQNVWEELAKGSIFVFPSRYEGFPNALGEAMATGLPVIGTNCPGPADLIQKDVNGLLVPSENTQELAKAMIALIESPQRRLELSQQARQVCDSFNQEKIMGVWRRVIEEG